jgi:hypothetical protein
MRLFCTSRVDRHTGLLVPVAGAQIWSWGPFRNKQSRPCASRGDEADTRGYDKEVLASPLLLH